jgi:hypothetical protein
VSSTVTVTVRCADCGRILASYYGVPRDREARARLAAAATDLLDWHRKALARCPASSVRTTDRADPR